MKQTKDLEQLIDRAIANDRGALPQQPSQLPADLLARMSSTPAVASNAAVSASSVGISMAVKIGIVAMVAAGSATWFALSRTTSSPSVPQEIKAPKLVQTVISDSARKPADSTKKKNIKLTTQKQAPVATATPFVPSEQNLPQPSGALETHVNDSTRMHVKVK